MSVVKPPELSIVVYCRDNRTKVDRCLASVTMQRTQASYEVVVVLADSDDIVLSNRNLRVVRCPDTASGGAFRNAGIRASKGKYLAFLLPALTIPEDWVDTVLEQQRQHSAVIGAIGNGNPNSWIATAGFICERNIWLTLPSGSIENAPAVNASYERALFDGSEFPDLSTESDIHFHMRLRTERGIRLHAAPRLLAFYHADSAWSGFLRHNFIEGKRYTNWRRESGRLDWQSRLMLIGLWWLIPLWLAQRTIMGARNDRAMQMTILRNLPLILFGWTARALGEVAVCFEAGIRARQSYRAN